GEGELDASFLRPMCLAGRRVASRLSVHTGNLVAGAEAGSLRGTPQRHALDNQCLGRRRIDKIEPESVHGLRSALDGFFRRDYGAEWIERFGHALQAGDDGSMTAQTLGVAQGFAGLDENRDELAFFGGGVDLGLKRWRRRD